MSKSVLFVVPPSDFRDEELFTAREGLEKQGFECSVACLKIFPAKSDKGREVLPDLELRHASSDSFDAVVFVGGEGSEMFFDHGAAHRLIQDFNRDGKIVAGTSNAPVILAKAGVLKGKQATAFFGEKFARALVEGGALVSRDRVVVSENAVTSNGPMAAREFTQALINALQD